MFVYDYECSVCHFKARAAIGAVGYYQLDDGKRMWAIISPCWCERCQTITLAEDLPDVGRLEASLQRIREHGWSDLDRQWAEQIGKSSEAVLARRQRNLEQQIEAHRGRTAPPRCLECGESDCRSLAPDDRLPKSFRHPGCAGEMKLGTSCHASPATYFLLDRNGVRISPPG
jgi:hypothetical protein